MNRKTLLELIEKGEGISIEFKQRFSDHKKIAKEMIAFANTIGGYIIFGVDDDTSVYGVESEKGEAELIKETAESYCEPSVNYRLYFVELLGKEIVIAEIFESQNKPVRIQDYTTEIDLNLAEVYIRVKDKSVPASKEMVKILQARTKRMMLKNYQVGKSEKIVFQFLDHNEAITVKQLGEIANISNRRASRTLIKLVRANLLNIHTKENGENFFTAAI
ncbi:RNA-binding domain-containing protein [Bacteroidota bacterium]